MRIALFSVLAILIATAVVWFYNDFSNFGAPPDPNDPVQTGMPTGEVLRRALAGTSEMLMERVRSGEITDDEFRNNIATAATALLDRVDIKAIPPSQSWEYAEIYIAARRWQEAKQVLEEAVRTAKGEDRRVNDNLRLARVLAELGDVEKAIGVARATFDTPDEGAAPILPATLYEIVPAGEGKQQDGALARLLEDAIACHMRTIVDPESAAGRAFLSARPFHVRRAWRKVVDLYGAAGEAKNADAAHKRGLDMLSRQSGA